MNVPGYESPNSFIDLISLIPSCTVISPDATRLVIPNSFSSSIFLYVSNEVSNLVQNLKEVGSKISDKVTKIKLAETISNIKKIKSVKKIKEQHLSALMMTYELLAELKNSLNK